MKRAFSLILALIMCLTLFSCGFDQKSYDTYLSGKKFEDEGFRFAGKVLKTKLSFDKDNCMEYCYTNGVGKTFRYKYTITKIEKNDDELALTMEKIYENTSLESNGEDEVIEVTYSIAKNTITYNSKTYKLAK